jgi:peptide/nickel transport system permease protein
MIVYAYLLKRILQSIPLLLGITAISFFVMYLSPGGPTDLMMDPKVKPEDRERMREALGLNQPPWVLYGEWLIRVLHGDFGISFARKLPVTDLLMDRLPQTLLLMGCAFLFTALLSIPLGILAAKKKIHGWIIQVPFLLF